MSKEPLAHLVFLRRGSILMVKRPEAEWRELQDEYADYMVSLGPWSESAICGYFALDYGEDDSRWPFARTAIEAFMQTDGAVMLESGA